MLPVCLFLRVHGQSKPYWSSRWVIATGSAPADANPSSPLQAVSSQSADQSPQPSAAAPADGPSKPTRNAAAQPGTEPSALPPRRTGTRWRQPALISAACLAIAAIGAGIYGLTRPCVLTETCPIIGEAQTLNQTARSLLTAPDPTPKAAMTAHEKLIDATDQLRQIPFWSSHHQQAQTLLTNYEQQADAVAAVVSAQRKGHEAAQASQDPPHPLETWEDIRQIWQEAIARLVEVPPDTVIAAIAQTKLAEYQANLDLIEQRIVMEQQAQNRVLEARQAAHLAETQEEVADSHESWQSAESAWQMALDHLAEVPAETMAYAEAQQLVAIYRPRLAVASERRLHEGISEDAYSQALQLANRALVYEQDAQWTQAVTYWRDALDSVEQVPQDTSFYDQARPLISSYHTALERSQQGLRLALVLQSMGADLDRVCRIPPELCSYTSTPDSLRLEISDSYGPIVERAMVAGGFLPETSRPAELINRINYLLSWVAQVGADSQVPVELYHADGSLFGTYKPETAGFVQPQSTIAAEPVKAE